MKISWKNILLWSLPALVIIFFVWQGFVGSNNAEFGKNIASSRMTYGRFLEYLDMGWVKRVDLYDDVHTAIVEAIGPELGNRIQRIRVELPATAPELISKLRKANVDIDAHPNVDANSSWGILGNLIFPIVLIGVLAFLFRRSGNMPGGPGQAMNFGKSKARFQMEAKTGVTFSDVAGVDEAKEEFEEVVSFLKRPERFTAVGAKIPKKELC